MSSGKRGGPVTLNRFPANVSLRSSVNKQASDEFHGEDTRVYLHYGQIWGKIDECRTVLSKKQRFLVAPPEPWHPLITLEPIHYHMVIIVFTFVAHHFTLHALGSRLHSTRDIISKWMQGRFPKADIDIVGVLMMIIAACDDKKDMIRHSCSKAL
jgi:hypothetical protein